MGDHHFQVLGVPVLLRGPESIVARLAICYTACEPNLAPQHHQVSAAIAADGSAFTVSVTDRETVKAPDPDAALRTLNHQLAHGIMLRRPDLFFVHAGVVSVDGHAIVLPGLSRAGKSTIVLALLLAGANFLSDELLGFDRRNGDLLPFPRAVKLRDECLGYFPGLAERCEGTGEVRFVPWSALPDAEVAAHAKPRIIALPEWVPNSPSKSEAIDRGAALLALTSSALNFGSHREASLDHLVELTENTATVRMRWSDPHLAAHDLLEHLRGMASTTPS